LEQYTFVDASVQQALSGFKLLQIDVTKNTDADKSLLKSHQLFGPPAILFYDKNSQESTVHRLIGFIDAEAFVAHIKRVKAI
jgi:thiol:disulfide interchange protein DsbD